MFGTQERFYLGHDEPQYEIDKKFLKNEKLWCRTKNIPALEQLKKLVVHIFGIKRMMLQLHQMVFLDLSWEKINSE